jgi:hypothetical protein
MDTILGYLKDQTGFDFSNNIEKIQTNKAGYTYIVLDLDHRIDWVSFEGEASIKALALERLLTNGHGYIKRVEPSGFGKVALMI